ncbi:hypothetical protein HU200_066067 [Digitaria exilis]|uniref:Serine/threonine-protein phosphatase 2A 55 kDa regulatory subunit B n=1 Tax=Digitaria exilis TaxID=1010633 RepID=A0A835A8D7_9POAL|nr:hypothetical protein HU200_066067 [Digitaria exilis]
MSWASPSSSSSSSSYPEPRPSHQLLQWKFSQVLGELPPESGGHRNGLAALQVQDDEDEISAIEFDGGGEYLAAGDNAGRVIIFRRTDGDDAGLHAWPRAELERADFAGAPPPRYGYATEFQSHQPEGRSRKNTRRRRKGEGSRPRWSTAALPLKEPFAERLATKRRGSSADFAERIEKVGDVGDGYSAKCRRVFDRAHEFNINSISNNCDGETFVSADDLRINLWHLEVTSQCFNIVDLKPKDMEDLVARNDTCVGLMDDEPEVITTAEFHPSSCSLLAYGSSRGLLRLVDLRRSALCDKSVRTFQDRGSRPQPHTFFTEIISCITDLKFTDEGRYLLTRDYMNLKLWDLRVETSPVATYKSLYTEDYIFDRFSCCASKDGSSFATGSYRSGWSEVRQQGGNSMQHGIKDHASNLAPDG